MVKSFHPAFLLCLLPFTVSADQVLYNGVIIEGEWPPATMDPLSEEPMPVPYLKNVPAVIPINVGRQLFVDDFLIEETDLKRVFHRPQPYANNPVMKPETAFEIEANGIETDDRSVVYLGNGGVFYDPKDEVFKMFYTAGWRGGLALATSKDLLNWERPELGLAGGNLILAGGDDNAGGDNSIWLDVEAQNPDERYKMITTRGRERGSRNFIHTLHTSPDGLQWSEGVKTGPASDYCSIFFNPFTQKWVSSIKQNTKRGRARFYSENADFMAGANWDNSVFWVNADRLDRPDPSVGDAPQLYSLNATPYESLMVGMFLIHRGPTNRVCEREGIPKNTDIAVAFSRDGFHWDRPDREPFIAGTRVDGDWDRAYLHSTTGVGLIKGDHIYFPYTGYSGIAEDGHRGMYTGASIGMAILRRDGFAAMQAADQAGSLTTRPLLFDGSHLFVNADCPLGVLKVEVLDTDGNVLEGFSAEDCLPVSTNSTIQAVTWKDNPNLEKLSGKEVRFRFTLENGSLYAFWVSPDESGASRGYVAAGGPGFDGAVDLAGKNAY